MDKSDRVMKIINEFYDNPKNEETYCLTDNLVRFILPRLKLFIKTSSKIIDWEADSKIKGIDIIGTLNLIIEDFEKYLKYSDETSSNCDYGISQSALRYGFIRLSLICEYLDW